MGHAVKQGAVPALSVKGLATQERTADPEAANLNRPQPAETISEIEKVD